MCSIIDECDCTTDDRREFTSLVDTLELHMEHMELGDWTEDSNFWGDTASAD